MISSTERFRKVVMQIEEIGIALDYLPQDQLIFGDGVRTIVEVHILHRLLRFYRYMQLTPGSGKYCAGISSEPYFFPLSSAAG